MATSSTAMLSISVPVALLGERQAEQVVVGERLAHVPRVLAGTVDLGRARRDLAGRKVADRRAKASNSWGTT